VNAAEKERAEHGRWLNQSRIPRDEQRRVAWGSLLMSTQTVQGLCTLDRKCVRRANHEGQHWPKEKP
jgi:hypothetical protein